LIRYNEKLIVYFQNPPWQTVTLSNTGEKEYGGLIFDVVKYLGKKLNFTYNIFSPANNRTIKFTQNETEIDVVRLNENIYTILYVLINDEFKYITVTSNKKLEFNN